MVYEYFTLFGFFVNLYFYIAKPELFTITDDSDELTNDPVFTNILNKQTLASQPTMSRFFNRMDEVTLMQFDWILYLLRKKIYSIKKPEMVLLDIDSTLFATYGKQEESGFNYHYSGHGYHPLLCYDGLTGDLLKATLRPGNVYSSTNCCEFLQPLLMEYQEDYPDIKLYLRGAVDLQNQSFLNS